MRWSWLVLFSILATACNKDAVSGEEDEAASGSSDDEDKDLDGWTIGDGDCDDTSNSINPGAEDICDGKDNNCDGEIDESGSNTFYIDYDGDGFGTDTEFFTISDCDAPAGYVSNADDCDDTDSRVNPSATEVCDGADNNCDGTADEGLLSTQYRDVDGDGFGDPALAEERCGTAEGYALYADDCDDSDPSVNPAAPEVCDGIDNNCREGIERAWAVRSSPTRMAMAMATPVCPSTPAGWRRQWTTTSTATTAIPTSHPMPSRSAMASITTAMAARMTRSRRRCTPTTTGTVSALPRSV